jgi:hypothetical protein
LRVRLQDRLLVGNIWSVLLCAGASVASESDCGGASLTIAPTQSRDAILASGSARTARGQPR